MTGVSRQAALGIGLALTCALFWGALPVALKLLLDVMDPITLTTLRFVFAAVVLAGLMAGLRRLDGTLRGARRDWRWLLLALLGLAGNFVLFLVALFYASPTVVQVVGQLGAVFLLFGGLCWFGERLSRRQWWGVGLLLVGLLLFFNRRLPELAHLSGGFGLGVGLALGGAALWALYGLAQKRLARHLLPQQTLMLLYPASALLLWPASAPAQVADLQGWQWALLGFACVNTLVAYGAFAESLRHLEASRVGAIISLTPLVTAGVAALAAWLAPGFATPEGLNAWSLLGVVLVVAGSAAVAMGGEAGG